MRIILLVLCMFVLATSAHATEWYLIDAKTAQCESARLASISIHEPGFASPYAMRDLFVKWNAFGGITVEHNNEGRVVAVHVKHRQTGLYLHYFPSLPLCDIGLALQIQGGFITDPNELK